jgi:hypothetical protein
MGKLGQPRSGKMSMPKSEPKPEPMPRTDTKSGETPKAEAE